MKKVNVTQSQIRDVLRRQDLTAIYRTAHLWYNKQKGERISSSEVYNFVRRFAPNAKVWRNAYNIAYPHNGVDSEYKQSRYGVFKPLRYGEVLETLRQEMSRQQDNYTKVFYMCNAYLVFASPVHRCKDYNKTYMMRIEGHKDLEFAKRVIGVCSRHFHYNPNDYLL